MSLGTTYLGLQLKNPLVASASPLNAKLDNLRRLEDAGAGAIVLPSLFQEQIEHEAAANDARQLAYADSSPEAMTYFPPASAGPYGLVLFNRLLEPDIDLVSMHLTDHLELSTPEELRLPLLWTAILAGRTKASLAISSGVAGLDEVVKCILAGADAVMTTSALLRDGIGAMTPLVAGLRRWMEEREIADLAAMRGMMSWQNSRDRSAYTRANYLRILERYAAAA